MGRRSAETWRVFAGTGIEEETAASAEGFAPANVASASSRRSRSPRAEDADFLEVIARQPRQQLRVELVVPEVRLILFEAETAKPPA
jgi:hypothetical protein